MVEKSPVIILSLVGQLEHYNVDKLVLVTRLSTVDKTHNVDKVGTEQIVVIPYT